MENNKHDYIQKIYERMNTSRRKYGTLKKCEFHLHTPASYDYNFYKNSSYSQLSTRDIINIAEEVNYINSTVKEQLMSNLEFYESEKYSEELSKENKPFTSFKEYFSYMLVAHKLYESDIEVAVVCDHNTVKGYKKLNYAVDEYFKIRLKKYSRTKQCVRIFLGVEISCSERNHLIAIFNENNERQVNSLLDEIISSESGGTYHTSQAVIDIIASKNLEAITYIAHLNSSNFIGTLTYNKTLFSSKSLNVFGLTELNENVRQRVYKKLKDYDKNNFERYGIIHEGDSHAIDTIGKKNTWVKFSRIDFSSLRKAFNDHKINIYTEKPEKSDKFIKGLLIYPGKEGFLGQDPSKNDKDFFIDFSRDLNCIIGGRGTGKSTILNIIETAFTLETQNIQALEMLSKHERMYILFFMNSQNYILEFVPQVKDKDKHYYIENVFHDKAIKKSETTGKYELSQNWIQLFRIDKDKIEKINYNNAHKTLTRFYKRGYSVNRIINQIENSQEGEFIKDSILSSINNQTIDTYISNIRDKRRNLSKYIKENANRIIDTMNTRESDLKSSLKKFNEEYKNHLEIVYAPNAKFSDLYLKELLENISSKGHILKTELTWDDVASFIQSASNKLGYIDFLQLLFSSKYKEIETQINIASFVNLTKGEYKRDGYSVIEREFKKIDHNNIRAIYEEIKSELIRKRYFLENSLINWFKIMDDFTLNFNINLKENSLQEKPLMKNIKEMSLGQKVAAILFFVFNYGYFVKDNTPLIIDQPEDNLDNQYIYKNLVTSLKKIKNNRQVIVVTHNSTIVTNSDTEQVIVLNSDGNRGWVENKGYPTDKRITRLIINTLEGGIESFNHKMGTYTLFLNELTNVKH
ncbi:Spaf_1101 family AAA-like ATPase [Priestia megaterium]|uniref:Spaf_1101 family AAA-like ATPase n=1 Tax=Priestia megaterium TaxID=1404 RepID=UPI002858F26D|nr:AAA family ATPase [Priestia megaterium]MDR7246849.1 ABC-type lipoprotein export system ATPase subunit [Priestia megaterium]